MAGPTRVAPGGRITKQANRLGTVGGAPAVFLPPRTGDSAPAALCRLSQVRQPGLSQVSQPGFSQPPPSRGPPRTKPGESGGKIGKTKMTLTLSRQKTGRGAPAAPCCPKLGRGALADPFCPKAKSGPLAGLSCPKAGSSALSDLCRRKTGVGALAVLCYPKTGKDRLRLVAAREPGHFVETPKALRCFPWSRQCSRGVPGRPPTPHKTSCPAAHASLQQGGCFAQALLQGPCARRRPKSRQARQRWGNYSLAVTPEQNCFLSDAPPVHLGDCSSSLFFPQGCYARWRQS